MDAPPVVGLADAPLIASIATGTLLAIEVGQTTRGQARAAIRRLRMTHAHVLGAVFTKLDTRKAQYGYGYAYAYAYEYDYSYGRKRAAETPLLGKDRDLRKPTAA